MKKYLPFILLGLGLLVLAGVYFFVIKGNGGNDLPEEEDEVVTEIPFDKRPVVSLTPIKEGHWLKLQISDLKVEAASLDYELLYKTEDGATQGVPGTVKLEGKNEFERELLLGSESSGKFRYDEGVEEGTLTLRFRNERGKLTGKLTTDFHLQANTKQLTSLDGKFSYNLNSSPKGTFFVVMSTFGVPGVTSAPATGPYGVFTEESDLSGKPEGDWKKVDYSKASNLGIFYK